jgi:hypothetical protein
MFLHRLVRALLLSLAFAAPSAYAFFDPPWITPVAPRAGEVVSVNIHGGICDGTIFQPGYPQITRTGNSIRIVEYGIHVDSVDLCIYPIGTLTETIGAFAPGEYTLTVDFTYDQYPLGLTTITLGVIPFTVSGSTPAASVSALTAAGRVALVILVLGSALLAHGCDDERMASMRSRAST